MSTSSSSSRLKEQGGRGLKPSLKGKKFGISIKVIPIEELGMDSLAEELMKDVVEVEEDMVDLHGSLVVVLGPCLLLRSLGI